MTVSKKQLKADRRLVEKLSPAGEGRINHRKAMLVEVAQLITSSLALEEVLPLTLEWATQAMDAEAGSVILLDKISDELVIKVATGPKGQEAQDKRFRKGEGIAGLVAEIGEPRIVSDVRRDKHFFDGIDQVTGFKTQSILAVPLQVKGKIIGVLEVLNKRGGQFFDDEDLKVFTIFADLAAIGIDNAGLYEEIVAENRRLQMRLELQHTIGQTLAMQGVALQMERAVLRKVTVLLIGDTGTGKGLVARVIHDRSPRRDKPFLTADCRAMPKGLREIELFGYKKGLFEVADGGTIFLDEIGNAPLELQTRLLHVLQKGQIRRVGETQVRRVDVRLIATTTRDLKLAVKEGTFREDLFLCLNVVPIVLPPIREHIEDLPFFLVDYFIEKYNQELGGRVKGVSSEVMQAFLSYSWPGNIRELENVIKQGIVMGKEGSIRLEDLPPEITCVK